jgi:hypothetical protein
VARVWRECGSELWHGRTIAGYGARGIALPAALPHPRLRVADESYVAPKLFVIPRDELEARLACLALQVRPTATHLLRLTDGKPVKLLDQRLLPKAITSHPLMRLGGKRRCRCRGSTAETATVPLRFGGSLPASRTPRRPAGSSWPPAGPPLVDPESGTFWGRRSCEARVPTPEVAGQRVGLPAPPPSGLRTYTTTWRNFSRSPYSRGISKPSAPASCSTPGTGCEPCRHGLSEAYGLPHTPRTALDRSVRPPHSMNRDTSEWFASVNEHLEACRSFGTTCDAS